MNQPQKLSYSLSFQILLAVCLIAAACIFQFRTITEYHTYINESKDEAMGSIAKAVDHTLLSIYKDYEVELNYILTRPEFDEGVREYLNSEDSADLLQYLESSLPGEKESIQTVLVYNEERILCSTDKKKEYFLPLANSLGNDLTVKVCSDYSNRVYLGFFIKKDTLAAGALMKMEDFCSLAENNSGAQSLGNLVLLDKDHTVFLRRNQEGIFLAHTLHEETDLDNPLIQMLIRSERETEITSEEYSEESNSTYLMVGLYSAAANTNGIFDIGVLSDREEDLLAIRRMYIQLIAFTAMFSAGMAILLLVLYRLNSQREKNMKEIRLLQEKRDAMEALNKETLEFAHHQRLETIGQLTSGIAHDFNNLLTPIMGYSVMVMEKLPPEDTESYDNLLAVYDASRKAKKLISRLSDLSRKNSDSTMREVNPDQMIRNAVKITDSSRPENVSLVQDLNCRNEKLYGNEIQFSQLMINLLINAFQALEPTGGLVRISTLREGDRIVIRVYDSGPGIPEEIRDKIFQPFFTTKSFGKGTGLGLAIVRQVVDEYKGTIQLDTEAGAGTEFIIRFPIEIKEPV